MSRAWTNDSIAWLSRLWVTNGAWLSQEQGLFFLFSVSLFFFCRQLCSAWSNLFGMDATCRPRLCRHTCVLCLRPFFFLFFFVWSRGLLFYELPLVFYFPLLFSSIALPRSLFVRYEAREGQVCMCVARWALTKRIVR